MVLGQKKGGVRIRNIRGIENKRRTLLMQKSSQQHFLTSLLIKNNFTKRHLLKDGDWALNIKMLHSPGLGHVTNFKGNMTSVSGPNTSDSEERSTIDASRRDFSKIYCDQILILVCAYQSVSLYHCLHTFNVI